VGSSCNLTPYLFDIFDKVSNKKFKSSKVLLEPYIFFNFFNIAIGSPLVNRRSFRIYLSSSSIPNFDKLSFRLYGPLINALKK